MDLSYKNKRSVDEIRRRFDADVERFSNLETGQLSSIDATLTMELTTRAAVVSTFPILRVLDVGCGAGNNTLKLLQYTDNPDCDLLDISPNMLTRARERVSAATSGRVRTICSDLRSAALEDGAYDVVLAAAVLHHLRDDADWEAAFGNLHRILRPGGSLWITDFVSHELSPVQELMMKRYGDRLSELGGDAFRDKVLEYIACEDSPRPVTYQLELLKKVGFRHVELLHKNSCFAAFGALK